MHVSMCVLVHTYAVYVDIYVHLCEQVQAYMCVLYIHLCVLMHNYIHTHMYLCVQVQEYMCALHACVYVC